MEKSRLVILSSVFLLLLIPGILTSNAFAVTTNDILYACDKPNAQTNFIYELDKTDGTIISSQVIDIDGISGKVKGCTAISQDPISGTYYAVIQTSGGGQSGRILATINPETGMGTKIDSMDAAISTLAFSSDGSLFAVVGAGSDSGHDKLNSVDLTNAQLNPLCSMPSTGTTYNYLVYNWNDDVMYRLAGNGLSSGLPGDIHLDRINDVTTCDVTTTSITGPLTGELFQASFNTNDQLYYVLARGGSGPAYYSLTTDGLATLINASPFSTEIKGLAFDLSLTVADEDGDGVPDGCDGVPIAMVTATPDSGSAPLDVSFTCDSTTGNSPFTYEWDFESDGVIDSIEANPLFTFDNVGDYTATCTITDLDNDSDTSSVMITTINPSLQDKKLEQITILESLIDDAPKKTQKELEKSIKEINKSLDDKLWEDETSLDPKKGKKVFDHEKHAVKKLMKIEKKDNTTDVSGVIDVLVAVDRQFATDAFDEANTPENQADKKSKKELEKSEKELAKGDEDRDNGKFDKAINHYKKSWEHAQHAMKEHHNHHHDDDYDSLLILN